MRDHDTLVTGQIAAIIVGAVAGLIALLLILSGCATLRSELPMPELLDAARQACAADPDVIKFATDAGVRTDELCDAVIDAVRKRVNPSDIAGGPPP